MCGFFRYLTPKSHPQNLRRFQSGHGNNFWNCVENPRIIKPIKSENKYRLHISIHISFFPKVSVAIDNLLNEAIAEEIIVAYKSINYKIYGKYALHIRNANQPYTIYLNHDCEKSEESLMKIGLLCEKIETILDQFKVVQSDYFESCDLRTRFPHIVFEL